MIWTKSKPTQPGYYFYRDERTNHDIVPVDYIALEDDLSFWNEWDKSWIYVERCSDDVEWSSEPITFPEEPKKENPWVSYVKEGK